ncbi:MAG: hypothetical protein ABL904_15395 [Hyphomicrobiaceae bacterium]
MKRLSAAALTVITLSSTAGAADLPQWVKGPVSGLVFGCEEAKQKAPKPAAYVTQGDLDGDGKPDYVVEIAKGCQANRDLYCNDEGCLIDLYVSTNYGQMGSFKVKSFKIGRQGTKPALFIIRAGAACAKEPSGVCSETLIFNGEKFTKAP